ncbi:MAG: hypothetical protein Q9M89_07790 [Persephonella sp.]|nr:hypothetical protein [Persephonella sp.]
MSIFLQPKFRLVKMGIQLINTGWLECGFEGNITLSLFNSNDLPVRLYAGMSAVHIFFEKTG